MSEPEGILVPKGIEKLAEITCGCSSTETTWGLFFAEMERLERGEFKPNDDLTTAVCAWAGISEHGTSVRGGWLTENGKAALAFLREHGVDWRSSSDEPMRFRNSEDVYYG